jgi:hypothetical protein
MSPTADRRTRKVSPPVSVPPAPTTSSDIVALDPLTTTWAAGTVFYRCYDVSWGSRDFYAGDPAHRGRFHPLIPVTESTAVPVLYGASDELGALSETVFHDVPVRGTKHVPHAKLHRRLIVPLSVTRDLTLVDLTSAGLSRLGLSRGELVESGARSYPDTAAWARALHDHPTAVDGMTWVSRQHDTSRAVVMFGDGVNTVDLEVPEGAIPLTLAAGAGLDLVCREADRAGITITGLAGS